MWFRSDKDLLDKKFTFYGIGRGCIKIEYSNDPQVFMAFWVAPDNKKIPRGHSEWALCGPMVDNLDIFNCSRSPIAHIKCPVSEDGNEVLGGDLKFTLSEKLDQRFEYELRHVANAKEGEEVFKFVSADDTGAQEQNTKKERPLSTDMRWFKVSSEYPEYELRSQLSKIVATITLTSNAAYLEIFEATGPHPALSLSDESIKGSPRHDNGMNMIVFKEAALATLFLSGLLYASIPPETRNYSLTGRTNILLPEGGEFVRADGSSYGPIIFGAEYNAGHLDKPSECSISIERRNGPVAHLERLTDFLGTSDFEFTLYDEQTIRRTIVHSVLEAPEQLLFSNDTGAMELIKDTQWYVSNKPERVVYELRKTTNSGQVTLSTIKILQDQSAIMDFHQMNSKIHVLSDTKLSEAGYQYEVDKSDLKMTIILESILVTCAILGIKRRIHLPGFHKWSQVIVADLETDKFLKGLPGSMSTSGAETNENEFELSLVCSVNPNPSLRGVAHIDLEQWLPGFHRYIDYESSVDMVCYDGLAFGSTFSTEKKEKILELYRRGHCVGHQQDPRVEARVLKIIHDIEVTFIKINKVNIPKIETDSQGLIPEASGGFDQVADGEVCVDNLQASEEHVPICKADSSEKQTVGVECLGYTVKIRVPEGKVFTKEETWEVINLVYFLLSVHAV